MTNPKIFAKFLIWRIRNLTNRNYILLLSIIVGLAAGSTALILKTSVFYLREFLLNISQGPYQRFLLLIYPAIGIFLVILLKKIFLNNSVKHNIASILYAISKRNSIVKVHKIFSSLIGGILTAGFGGSVGLESPNISSGAAIGSNIGRKLGLDYKSITLLLACGSSGAIAAIFNTPIAAVVFGLEILLLDLTRFSLGPLLMASVSGAIVTKVFLNEKILFDITIKESFVLSDVPFFIILSIITGFIGIYFTRVYLAIEKKFETLLKSRKKIIYSGAILGILLVFFPPLYGEGFVIIKQILSGNFTDTLNNTFFEPYKSSIFVIIIFFSILILLKVVSTAITISAGGVGGIFAPSLFTGAITGFLFAYIINQMDIGIQLSLMNFALIGMASTLAGILHAPLTGIFLIVEMTSGYQLIVPLMLTTTISYITVKYLEPHSIITKQLAMRGELITHNKDKAVLTFMQLKSVIETDLKSVNVNATLGDMVKIIAKSKRNIFPVVDKNNNLVGIILLDDIREIMFIPKMYESTYVRNLMTIPPSYINNTDSMEVVMKKFKETNAWNLPVVDNGKYIGFVSKSKMFSVYRKQLVDISSD